MLMHAFQVQLMIKKFSQLHAKKVSQLQQNKVHVQQSQSSLVQVVLHQPIKLRWFLLAAILLQETQKEVIGGLVMTVNKQ